MKRFFLNNEMKCSDTLTCILNLNNLDIKVYKTLLNEKKRADEISQEIGKDRSTIQRSLQRLISCKICKRERHFLEKGGHYYVYSAIHPKKAKEVLKKCIEEWHKKMLESLKNFEREFINTNKK